MLMSSQRIFLVKKLILTANLKVSGIEKRNHFKSRFFLLNVRKKLYVKYFLIKISLAKYLKDIEFEYP